MIEKYQQLVAMLHDQTEEGKVEWKKTSSNEYMVSIGGCSISILYHEVSPNSLFIHSTPDVTFLKLSLWNPNGELIDDVKIEKRDYGSADYDKLMNLYTAARRQYGKVNIILDTIISDLTKETEEEK